MLYRTERMKKVFASVFLLGYVSFVLLSITHFHQSAALRSDNKVLSAQTSTAKTLSDPENNCPVCHLYSSVNYYYPRQVISNILAAHIQVPAINETGYQSEFFKSLSLRAPPSLI